MFLDKQTKKRLEFNLRNQSKPKTLQQLVWYIDKDRLKVLGEYNKREIAHICSVEAKKLLKTNLECVSGNYSWKQPQDASEIPQPSERPKPEEAKNIKDNNSKIKEDSSNKENFFDDDDGDDGFGKPETRPKPVTEPPIDSRHDDKPKTQDAIQSKGDDDEFGFDEFDDEGKDGKKDSQAKNSGFGLDNLEESHRHETPTLKVITDHQPQVTDNDAPKNVDDSKTDDKAGDMKPEGDMGHQAEHDKSTDSIKSSSSVISRRSLVFDGSNYTISAYKNIGDKTVMLKLAKKGEKDVIDEWPIDHPEAEDEEQLINLGRSDLRACQLEANEEGGVQMVILEDEKNQTGDPKDANKDDNLIQGDQDPHQEAKPANDLQSLGVEFGSLNIGDFAKIFDQLIQPLHLPLFTQAIDENVTLNVYIEEQSKYGLSLLKKNEPDKEASLLDFYITDIDKQDDLTDEDYKQILSNYRVKQTDVGLKIEPIQEDTRPDQETDHHDDKSPRFDTQGDNQDADYNIEVDDGEEEGEEEEDMLGLGDNKPKFEVIVVRSKDEDDIVEVYSMNKKKNKEVDKRKLKCEFEQNAPPGAHERLLKRIGMRWQADKNTGRLIEIEIKEDLEDDDHEGGKPE